MEIPIKFPLISILFFIIVPATLQYPGQGKNTPQDFLHVHNAARRRVGVEPMIWDEHLAAFARNYVNRRIGDCNLVHSTNRPYGENLAKGGCNFTARAAVNLWVREKLNYDHSSNTCAGGGCRRYKQVVWRNSVRLGCARAQCKDGWWFVSCNYDPPGNIGSQRPY